MLNSGAAEPMTEALSAALSPADEKMLTSPESLCTFRLVRMLDAIGKVMKAISEQKSNIGPILQSNFHGDHQRLHPRLDRVQGILQAPLYQPRILLRLRRARGDH